LIAEIAIHARHVAVQMAEAAVERDLFADIPPCSRNFDR
jgi:hypothetical protein